VKIKGSLNVRLRGAAGQKYSELLENMQLSVNYSLVSCLAALPNSYECDIFPEVLKTMMQD
jgi:hypothetical protein